MQIYKGMDIGTAKPPQNYLKQIKHHCLDVAEPDEDFDVAKFKKMAETKIEEILQKGKIPLVSGGTGLYIKALSRGLCQTPSKDKKIRKKLEELAETKGKSFLYQQLQKIDPEAAGRIHSNDLQRIIRALEVYEQTGLPLSSLQTQTKNPESKFNFIKIGLMRPRKELYKRAEERIEKMFQNGWIEEVKTLIQKGYHPELPAMHSLGYREIIQFVDGKATLNRTRDLIKRNTRRFIKRQITWFKKEKDIHWVFINKKQSKNGVLSEIKKILAREGIQVD